jgi:outer membrane protein assembly factor BamB
MSGFHRTLVAAASGVVFFLVVLAGGAVESNQTGRIRGPAIRWRVATPAGEDYVLAVGIGKDGVVYARTWVGTDLHVFGSDGVSRGNWPIGRALRALAVGREGTVYAGGDGIVSVFAPDGTLRSTLAAESPRPPSYSCRSLGSLSAVAIGDDGVVYVGCANGVFAVDITGRTHWYANTLATPGAIAVGRNGTVFAAAGSVYAFASDGALKSKFNVSVPGVEALMVGQDGTLYAASADHTVHAIDPNTYAMKWTFRTRGTPFALAEGKDRSVYVGSYDSNIYALDPQSSKLRWRFSTGRGEWGMNPVHALAVGDDVIYAGVGSSVEAIDLH